MTDTLSSESTPTPESPTGPEPSFQPRRRLRTLTLTALLGVFVVAVLLAVARAFLPARLSGLLGRAKPGEE
jgi:hypothetical protein